MPDCNCLAKLSKENILSFHRRIVHGMALMRTLVLWSCTNPSFRGNQGARSFSRCSKGPLSLIPNSRAFKYFKEVYEPCGLHALLDFYKPSLYRCPWTMVVVFSNHLQDKLHNKIRDVFTPRSMLNCGIPTLFTCPTDTLQTNLNSFCTTGSLLHGPAKNLSADFSQCCASAK